MLSFQQKPPNYCCCLETLLSHLAPLPLGDWWNVEIEGLRSDEAHFSRIPHHRKMQPSPADMTEPGLAQTLPQQGNSHHHRGRRRKTPGGNQKELQQQEWSQARHGPDPWHLVVWLCNLLGALSSPLLLGNTRGAKAAMGSIQGSSVRRGLWWQRCLGKCQLFLAVV